MKNMNVLVFPAGSEIAIEIYDALKLEKDVSLFGATSTNDHAEFLFERLYTGLPFFYEPSFIEELNRIICEAGIEYIYPARDDVQLFLTQHESELLCRVATSELETVEICRSKRKTYEVFKDQSFTPATYMAEEIGAFPVFAKPTVGEGSKGAKLITDEDGLASCIRSGIDYVFCEYLEGPEYTVDCLTDAKGQLRVCMPRTRDRTRAGISVRSRSVSETERFVKIANVLNSRLAFLGAWFFQVKEREDGSLALLEASPRIAGTMGLSRNAGVNFPLLTLYSLRGLSFDIVLNDYKMILEKAFISRYKLEVEYRTIYVDYDDTIIVKGRTNTQIMQFLYQSVNQGKRIVLLTRHDGDIEQALIERRIAKGLFDRIVHLDSCESKADYIDDDCSILIDDSFSERLEVHRRHGIWVFDPSNIEALLDWRQ